MKSKLVLITEEQSEWLEEEAWQRRCSMNELVRNLIDEAMKESEETKCIG